MNRYVLPWQHLIKPNDFGSYAEKGWVEVGRVDELILIGIPPSSKMPDAEPSGFKLGDLSAGMIKQTVEQDPDLALAQCLITIMRLGDDIAGGDGKALWRLAQIAGRATELLHACAKERPAALAPIARKMARWPMMRSTNPRNSGNDELLKDIALGADLPINLDTDSKWDGDAISQIALSIYEYLRDLPKVTGWKPLPPLTRATGKLWWDNGWYYFLATYPNPHLVPDLDRLITAPSKRTSPGKIREELKRKIRDRFMAIAKR